MVFNSLMDDRELILQEGGPAKLAAKLGYDKRSGVQRVHNWMTRGIPPRVKLAHPEIFLLDRGGRSESHQGQATEQEVA